MTDFLDEVLRDLSQEETKKRLLQQSIRSLSSQVKELTYQVNSDKKTLSRMAELFRQEEIRNGQHIDSCTSRKHDLANELSIADHKISCLRELETLKGPLDFGRFPGEIRKMILEWVLVGGSPIGFGRHSTPNDHRPRSLAIFQASKQIYAEAAAVFYGQNKFVMDGTNLERFLISTRVNNVRHLSLYLDARSSITKVLRNIERCQCLKSLCIRLVTAPRFQGREKCNEQRLRLLKFKRPARLEQVNMKVYHRSSQLNMILEPLCRILQDVLEGHEFEQPLQGSFRSDPLGRTRTSVRERNK